MSPDVMSGVFGLGGVLFGWLLHAWTSRRRERRTAGKLAEIFDMEIWDLCQKLRLHPVPFMEPIRSDLFENYFEKAFELPPRATMALFIWRKNLLACEKDRQTLFSLVGNAVRTNTKDIEQARRTFMGSVEAVLLSAQTYTLKELRKVEAFNYAGAWERFVDKFRPRRAAEKNALVQEDPFPVL